MEAVRDNKDWVLSFTNNGEIITKTVNARNILMLLAKRNWEMAEPGILYWDRICDYNMLNTDPNFKYAGVNPCSEEPLSAGSSCLLGSLNLSNFVKNPFTDKAEIDFNALSYSTKIAINALNEVLIEGMPLHPLQEQRDSVNNWHSIGLGTFGLGDMLIKLGLKYGSPESLEIISKIYKNIAVDSILASLEKAKTDGCYPMCNKEALVESSFIKAMDLSPKVLDEIKKYGLYNNQLLTCPPCGTIATMISVSSGIEPNFAFEFNRRTLSLNKEEKTYKVYASIVKEYQQVTGNKDLPDYFITAEQINPVDRIKVQACLQQALDASISSTINLPESATVEDIYNIYYKAWEYGLKGVTVYRDNCLRQGILTTGTAKNIEPNSKEFNTITPVSRKQMGTTCGCTFCKKSACGTLYVTANKDEKGNFVEVFTHTSKGGVCQANLNAVTRGISLALRSGVKVDEVIDQLSNIHCPACSMAKAKGKIVDGTSCPDIIAKVMREFSQQEHKECCKKTKEQFKIENKTDCCPECGTPLIHEGGCVICQECGYSKCS